MALTLAEANQVIQGAINQARDMKIRISVAVCDAGGRLIAFNRMDGAIWGSVYGCQGKAIASAGFSRPSGELAERAGSPIIQGIVAAEGGHMIPSPGAVPIIRNGVLEGADGGDAEHHFYTRLVNDLAIYGIGLARRDRTLQRLERLLTEYRAQPATFACTLVPRKAPGAPRAGCAAQT